MRNKHKLVLIGSGAVVVIALILAVSSWNLFSTQGSAVQSEAAQHALAQYTEYLGKAFLQSKQTPLREGDTFPILDFPVIRGSAPDWSKPTVITLGNPNSSSAVQLFTELLDAEIQKIHVYSTGNPQVSDAAGFPEDVVILSAVDGTSSLNIGVSSILNGLLGVFRTSSAYLLGENREILYAHLNHAGFDDLAEAAGQFTAGGAAGVKPNDQVVLMVGDPLPLETLPEALREEIQSELEKPATIIFFLDSLVCDICEGLPERAHSYVESWVAQGYGVLTVESGHSEFSTHKTSAGALTLLDVRAPTDSTSELAEAWGVVTLPATMIFIEGEYQGSVPYGEIEVDGSFYRDVQFQAIDEILRTALPGLGSS